MKFLITLLACITFQYASGQDVKKKDVRGLYSTSTGLPARTIKKGDSSTISIPSITFSKSMYHLKRFGRVVLTNKANDLEGKTKGSWTLNGDIITIHVGGTSKDYRYQYPCYLSALDGKGGIQKD
jgi:hypothetical protein